MTTLKINKTKTLTAQFFTEAGQPAKVDGDPKWYVSDEVAATIEPTSNPFQVKLRGVTAGSLTVYAVADADLGRGVREITLSASIQVLEDEAAGGEIIVTDDVDDLPAEEQEAVREIVGEDYVPPVDMPVVFEDPAAPSPDAQSAPVQETPPADDGGAVLPEGVRPVRGRDRPTE